MPKTTARVLCVAMLLLAACPCASALADGQHVEVLSGAMVGLTRPTIALDSHDLPWIAFHDPADRTLHVMHRGMTGWIDEQLASGLTQAMVMSIAIDEIGRVHLLAASYTELLGGAFPISHWLRDEEGTWSQTVLAIGAAGSDSLVLDDAGWPHVVYRTTLAAPLTYSWQDESGWHSEPVAGTEWRSNADSTLVRTDAGQMILITGNEPCCTPQVWRRLDTGWQMDATLPPALANQRFALLDWQWLHSVGQAGPLQYAAESQSGWTAETIPGGTGTIGLSLMQGADGTVHVAQPWSSQVGWYRHSGSSWSSATVPFTRAMSSELPDGAVDRQGRVHLACQASGNDVLYCVLSDYTEPEPSFDAELSVSPTTFGPGWNLNYTLVITNTGPFDLPDLAATSVVPEGACCPANGADTDLPAEIGESPASLRWDIPMLEVGDVLRLTYRLHSLSMVGNGETISNTVSIGAAYMGSTTVGVEAACDTSLAPTSTPTCTPSPTPTTPAYGLVLPMIMMDKP